MELSFPGSWETGTGLGEPVPVCQLPGRGILRIHINNVVLKRVFVNKILCILNPVPVSYLPGKDTVLLFLK